jgi:hypothetical protein
MPNVRTLITTLEMAKLTTYTAVSPTPPSMGVENLKHVQPTRRMRSTDPSALEFVMDVSAALASTEDTNISFYRFLWFLYYDGGRNDTVEVWTGPTLLSVGSTATANHHIGPQQFRRTLDNDGKRFPRVHSFVELPVDDSDRAHPVYCTDPWIRVKISAPTPNPRGYLDLGLAFATPGYIPDHPIAQKPALGLEEAPRETEALNGATRAQIRPRRRTFDCILQATGPGCVDELEEDWIGLQETVGISEPVVVCLNLDATQRFMTRINYGTLASLAKVPLSEVWNLAQMNLSVKEKL